MAIKNKNDDSELERGSFDLNGNKKANKKKNPIILIFALLLIFSAIGGGIWFFILKDDKPALVEEPIKRDAALDRTLRQDSTVDDLKNVHIQAEREKAEQERKRREQEAANARKRQQEEEAKRRAEADLERKKQEARQMTGQAQSQGQNGGREGEVTPEQRKMSGDIVVQLPRKNSRSGDAGTAGNNASSGGKSDSLKGTNYADGSVSHKNAAARKFLLSRGTTLRCALYTEIVTDYPGPVLCRLTKDLYSSDGSIKLAEAGSLLSGERSVSLEPGKARIFTQWRELETPNGIRAQIDSLGTGPLGATGTEAWIDNHYMQRFGGAILLSLFDDTLATLENLASNDSKSDVTYDNSSDNASEMASIALEQSINIAPTGHVLAGTVINVLVVRDIDFSSIYTTR
ncbi:hypothetical protein ABNR98_004437 [Salmonella enterica]